MSDYCCIKMNNIIEEGEVPIIYCSKFREYGIKICNSDAYQAIDYCPWCGKKFPVSLRDEWFDTLEKMLQNFDGFADRRIPDDFQSDKWWKERCS